MPKVGMEPIRRNQIIEAVLDLVAEKGLDMITLDSIAEQAGVSKGVISYYYKGKDDVLLQSYREFLDYFYHDVENRVHEGTKPGDILLLIGDSIFFNTKPDEDIENRKMREKYSRIFVHFYSRTILDEGFKKIYHEYYRVYLEGIAELYEAGVQSGEFIDMNKWEFACGYMAILDGLTLMKVMDFQPKEIPSEDVYRGYIKRLMVTNGGKNE